MISFSRTDSGIFGAWWWTVDRVMLFSFFAIMIFGVLMAAAATPMVANRIGLERFYFLKRHLAYMIPSLLTIFFVSTFDNAMIKKFSLALFALSIGLIVLTLLMGAETKGAKRWVMLFGFSIQPSEFAKPALMIITAWMFAKEQETKGFRGRFMASISLSLLVFLLLLQPDIGMILVTTSCWFGQLFLNGLSLWLVLGAVVFFLISALLAYMFFPHVTLRVDKFFNPAVGDHYQINRSLEAFSNGGLWGTGPGEGIIKKHLPDAHSDFVFAVLGEEFGFVVCLAVIILLCFIVVYGMTKALKENDLFSILASVGLLAQFGLQSFINIASTVHLIPTKGITLPFMSYGGSSMLAASISVGMILALGKHKNISYAGVG
ncbi:MAG: putative lipid II flippase FtsW [Holosporaceae bacterium]|jgi:cell division protein FtsW|nr:putative lipid II flippase FtsW [Holosporaceae bacterium]